MTFSIAIPVHNGEKYLKATLASALNQKRPADEIVAVDDASTDQSAQILRSPEWGGRIQYIFNEKSSGFVDAWNRVVNYSQSDYVTILHQDDLLDPDYLYHIEQALKSYPNCKHIYSGYYYIDELGNRIGESPKPHTLTPKVISGKEYAHRYLGGVVRNRHIHRCPGVTTERNLLLEKCKYRKEAGLIADDDFFIRVGHFTDIIEISQPLASFRNHDESATGRLESLSYRLAHDYIFSLHFHHQHREYLDDEGKAVIAQLASRFINQLLFDSVKSNNESWINTALQLSEKVNTVVPKWKTAFLPPWSKILWFLIYRKKHFSRVAHYYCTIIGACINIKVHLMKKLSVR